MRDPGLSFILRKFVPSRALTFYWLWTYAKMVGIRARKSDDGKPAAVDLRFLILGILQSALFIFSTLRICLLASNTRLANLPRFSFLLLRGKYFPSWSRQNLVAERQVLQCLDQWNVIRGYAMPVGFMFISCDFLGVALLFDVGRRGTPKPTLL